MLGWLRRAPRVYFMNDTTAEHAGSQAAMRSLISELSDCKIIGRHTVGQMSVDDRQFDAADWIVANGEGTIHHNVPKGEFILSCLARAQSAGKKTALVNCVYQQTVNNHPEVLARLNIFTVREVLSKRCAGAHGGTPIVRLDSAADRSVARTGVPIPGLPAVAYGATHVDAPTNGAINPNFGLAAPFDDIVATLRNVEVYVTGQHHGVYAAAIARCTFVPLESNSHKISGLIEWSGSQIPVIRSADASIDDAIAWARDHRRTYEMFFDWFADQDVTRLRGLEA
jgi:hypothetical protein